MKVVLVTGTYLPYIAGVSTSTHNIARSLADHGNDVTVIAPNPIDPAPAVDSEKGLHIVRAWAMPDPWYPGRTMSPLPFTTPSVYNAITPDVDIVHIQESLNIGLTALFAARRLHIPVVGALHFTPEQVARMVPWLPPGWSIALTHMYIRWVFNKYDAIMVPTQTFVNFLHSVGVTKPTQVVSNGVNTKEYAPSNDSLAVRKKLKLPADNVIFLVLGRLDPDKYVNDVIAALPNTSKNIYLVIAGLGPLLPHLQELAKTLGVGDRIRWIGQINNKEMVELYHAVDGFIMMGVHEVQSIVTLQAAATGMPIVAARAGALPELVHDEENGFLVPPHDSETLAKKLNTLAADKELRKRMGAKSRQISLVHDKAKAMARIEAWYKEVIAAYKQRKRI